MLDAERVAASMADAQRGEYFLVDANGAMTVEHALRFLRLLPSGLGAAYSTFTAWSRSKPPQPARRPP